MITNFLTKEQINQLAKDTRGSMFFVIGPNCQLSTSCKEVLCFWLFKFGDEINMYDFSGLPKKEEVRNLGVAIRVDLPKPVLKTLAQFCDNPPQSIKIKDKGNFLYFPPGHFFLSHYLLLDFLVILVRITDSFNFLTPKALAQRSKTFNHGAYSSLIFRKAALDFEGFLEILKNKDFAEIFETLKSHISGSKTLWDALNNTDYLERIIGGKNILSAIKVRKMFEPKKKP